ncbi:MAG: hypothetical protein WBM90_13880, partial [Acidimicrobiia bacterium]
MKNRGGLALGPPDSDSDPDPSDSQTIRARLFGASVWLNITVLVLFSPALFVVLGWFTESYRDTASASEVSHRVHEVAFGALFCLALVGAYSQFRPKHNLAGMLQLIAAVVLLAFMTTFSIGIDVGLLLYLIPLAILLALRPWGGPVREGGVWGLALILVLVSALPFLDETAGLISRALSGAQNHTSHWSAMATFVIILPVLGLVAALRFTGYRLVAWSVSAAAAVYGSASLLFPYDAS